MVTDGVNGGISSAVTRQRPGPQPRIARASVLEAARRLSPKNLTMRALARELGVTHAALYRYFPDREAVFAALVADHLSDIEPPAGDLDWQEWLRRMARSIRTVSRELSPIADTTTWQQFAPAARNLVFVGLTVLRRTFPPAEAISALGAIARFSKSFGADESELRAAQEEPLPPELQALLPQGFRFRDMDDAFERELTAILTGIDVTFAKLTNVS